jgi:hypothetical protein
MPQFFTDGIISCAALVRVNFPLVKKVHGFSLAQGNVFEARGSQRRVLLLPNYNQNNIVLGKVNLMKICK